MPANSGNATFSSIGELLPSPSSFGPGEYETVLEAEAKKKADYLSQMDQFYAQLDEMERQFDLDIGLRERLGDIEADRIAGQEKLGWFSGISQLGLGAAKMFQNQFNTNKGYDWAEEMYGLFDLGGGGSDFFDLDSGFSDFGSLGDLFGGDAIEPDLGSLDYLFDYVI